MKVLLATAILLIIAQSVTSAALGRPKREEENLKIPDETKDELVERFNKLRKETAKNHRISNMHKLSWNGDLEDKVKHSKCGRGMEEDAEEFTQKIQGKSSEEALKIMDEFAQDTIIGCINPVQTEVACIVRKCGEGNKPLVNCVCGPENGFSKSNVKEGDPGSDCDGSDEDGLCEDNSSTNAAAVIGINLIAFYTLASFVL